MTTHTPELQIWERLDNEPEDAYQAFKRYRDMRPPRRALSVQGYTINKCYGWAGQFRWQDRVKAYDRHFERIILEERDATLRQKTQEVTVEHMQILKTARDFLQRELDKYLVASNEGVEEAGHLAKISELQKLMETIIKFDRLVRDQTTDNIGHDVDLSGLSIDELKKLREIREKINNGRIENAPNPGKQDPVPREVQASDQERIDGGEGTV